MAASDLDTSSIFEPPENIANQHVTPLPMTCFAGLDSLMAEGKGADWTEYIRRGSPSTGQGYWAWDRLTHIQRHIKDASQDPELIGETLHLLYNDDDFRTSVKGASRMVDKVCQGENGGKEAGRLEGETRKYLIPACVAIIKAVFERAGGAEGLGSFTKVTLEVIVRALDWVYKLMGVVSDGDGWKGRLEEALEPLAGSVLVAMRDIRNMEAGDEESEEESRDRDESMEEERGGTGNGDDGLEVESNGGESDGEDTGDAEPTAEPTACDSYAGEESTRSETGSPEPTACDSYECEESSSLGSSSSDPTEDCDDEDPKPASPRHGDSCLGGLGGEKSDIEEGNAEESDREDSDANEGDENQSTPQESNGRDTAGEDEESDEEEESNDEDGDMEEARLDLEHLKEEHLLDAYSQSGYEPDLESGSDYSTTAQATRSKRRRTRSQTANFSKKVNNGDATIGETETRADGTEHESPPPSKWPCRRELSPCKQTDSEELTGPKTRSRQELPAWAKGLMKERQEVTEPKMESRKELPTWAKESMKESMKEGPRRSARVKKLQTPKKDVGRLGIPNWVEAPLYTTVYNSIGNGERAPMSTRRGFLVRDGLGFFASKEERLRQG